MSTVEQGTKSEAASRASVTKVSELACAARSARARAPARAAFLGPLGQAPLSPQVAPWLLSRACHSSSPASRCRRLSPGAQRRGGKEPFEPPGAGRGGGEPGAGQPRRARPGQPSGRASLRQGRPLRARARAPQLPPLAARAASLAGLPRPASRRRAQRQGRWPQRRAASWRAAQLGPRSRKRRSVLAIVTPALSPARPEPTSSRKPASPPLGGGALAGRGCFARAAAELLPAALLEGSRASRGARGAKRGPRAGASALSAGDPGLRVAERGKR